MGGGCITLNFSLIRYIISYRHIVVLHVHTPYIPGENKNKHLAQYFGIRFIIYHLSCSRQQNKERKRKKKETGIQ